MNWLLQFPEALTAYSVYLAARRPLIGWPLGVVSQVTWAVWATLAHAYGMYPWAVIWSAVLMGNWIRARQHA
jgi:hypothetical protein